MTQDASPNEETFTVVLSTQDASSHEETFTFGDEWDALQAAQAATVLKKCWNLNRRGEDLYTLVIWNEDV